MTDESDNYERIANIAYDSMPWEGETYQAVAERIAADLCGAGWSNTETLLVRLSERTREKWEVEDRLGRLTSILEAVRNDWLRLDADYRDGRRATNAIVASVAASRLAHALEASR